MSDGAEWVALWHLDFREFLVSFVVFYYLVLSHPLATLLTPLQPRHLSSSSCSPLILLPSSRLENINTNFVFTRPASYGSAGTSGASNSMANSIGIGSATGECRDYTGRTIQHAMHFVPPGVDMCKLCICENGHAKVRLLICLIGSRRDFLLNSFSPLFLPLISK